MLGFCGTASVWIHSCPACGPEEKTAEGPSFFVHLCVISAARLGLLFVFTFEFTSLSSHLRMYVCV